MMNQGKQENLAPLTTTTWSALRPVDFCWEGKVRWIQVGVMQSAQIWDLRSLHHPRFYLHVNTSMAHLWMWQWTAWVTGFGWGFDLWNKGCTIHFQSLSAKKVLETQKQYGQSAWYVLIHWFTSFKCPSLGNPRLGQVLKSKTWTD